jgi:hypothetical protein
VTPAEERIRIIIGVVVFVSVIGALVWWAQQRMDHTGKGWPFN